MGRRGLGARKGMGAAVLVLTFIMLQSCGPNTAPAAPPKGSPAPAVAPEAPPSGEAEPRVPTAFQGEWNMDLSACGSGLHDSQLLISEGEVRFYESGGPVTAARLVAPHRLEVAMALSGEGETWTERRTFQLSPDGAALTDVTTPDGLVRRRCPAAP